MPKIRFKGFASASPVAITAGQGSTLASASVPLWNSSASVRITATRSNQRLAPDPVWFSTTVSGFDVDGPAPGEVYDPRIHEIWYFWEFYVGDSTPRRWNSPENIPDGHNDRRVGYGPWPCHVFREPGTYRVAVTAIDRSGNMATDEVTVIVGSADLYYSAAQTIVVSSDGDFAGAPPHQIGNRHSDLDGALLSYAAMSGEGRVVVKRGTSYTMPTSRQWDGNSFANFRLEAWGSGPKPVIQTNGNRAFAFVDFDEKDLSFSGVEIRGLWDPDTETGTRSGSGLHFFETENGRFCVHDCTITKVESCVVFLEYQNGNQGSRFAFDDLVMSNYAGYAVYCDVSAGALASFTGVALVQSPNALAGGHGQNMGNAQGSMRTAHTNGSIYFDACDFFSNAGWTLLPNAIGELLPVVQSTLRWNASSSTGAKGFMTRCTHEGFLSVGVSGRPGNLVIDKCLFIGNFAAHNFSLIAIADGGTTIRNSMFVQPDVPTLFNGSWEFFFLRSDQQGGMTAENAAAPVAVYSNTFVALHDFQNFSLIDQRNNEAFSITKFDLYTLENNVLHAPNLATPKVADAPFISSPMPGVTPRTLGFRWGFKMFFYDLPANVPHGGSFNIPYLAIPDRTGEVLGPGSFPGPWHAVENFNSTDGKISVLFGPAAITITNTSGETITAGRRIIRLDRHGNLPSLDTTYAVGNPDLLWIPAPGSPAADDGDEGFVACDDFFGRLRDVRPHRGAVEPL